MEFNARQLQKLIASNNYSVSEYDEKLQVPTEFIKKILASDFLSSVITSDNKFPAIFECMTTLGYFSEDNGVNFAIGAHLLSGLIPLQVYGDSQQKNEFLEPTINQGHIIANAITESESGSDAFNMKTTASREGNSYVLSGEKSFVTNCSDAEWFIVYAVTNESKGALGGVSVFLVHNSEIQRGKTHVKMGLRTCSSGEIILNNVSIPANRLIGGEGAGLKIFNAAMSYERYGLSAMHVGTMRRLFESCVDFTSKRKTSEGAIIKNQVISHRLAEMKVLLLSAEAITEKILSKEYKGTELLGMSAACKLHVSENYVTFCKKLNSIYAGQGYTKALSIERMHRDAQASLIYSGTNDIQKNLIATFLVK